jgi:hypothetical protein
MDSLEQQIRSIVADEISKRKGESNLVAIADFCKSKNISRVTLWRSEREGKTKLVRIGSRVFVDENQWRG